MTQDPWQLVADARCDGLRFSIADGAVKVAGDEAARNRWLATLRELRPAILTALEQEQAVIAWLDRIGETDEAIRAEVLDACRDHADRRAYFVGRAREGMPEGAR